MYRIFALLLSFGALAASHGPLHAADSSSYSILPGNYNLIGFNDTKHYLILENNKIFKVLDSAGASIVAHWTIGTQIRLIPQNKSKIYALVNITTGESVSMKHKHHLPDESTG